MIDLVIEEKERQCINLTQLIEDERKIYETQSLKFLSWDFPRINEVSATSTDKNYFLIENYNFISSLIFFPTKPILRKFHEMNIRKQTTKWFVDINELESILLKLSQVDDTFFPVANYFYYVKTHLELKAKLSFLEGIAQGFDTIYNGKETNLLYKTVAEGKRKEKYRLNLGYKSEASPFENFVMEMYRVALAKYNGEIDLAKLSQGNFKAILLGLEAHFTEDRSKRQIYIMLFELLRLVHKDLDLLDEDSFIRNFEGNYKNYDEYKYNEVKNFFRKV